MLPSPVRQGRELDQVSQELLEGYFERHPDLALERRWPGGRIALGRAGTEAALRWRDVLVRAQRRLARFEPSAHLSLAGPRLEALTAWVESELLCLEALALARTDPGGYAERAARILRAASEATWRGEQARTTLLRSILLGFPAYWTDARASLVELVPDWIDLALEDLLDLEDLVRALAPPETPPAELEGARRSARDSALASIASFRRWLLDSHSSSGNSAVTLGPEDWLHLVQSVSGSPLSVNAIKSGCLRHLAQLDPPVGEAGAEARVPALDPLAVAANVRNASAQAFALAREAGVVNSTLDPESLAIAAEEGLRSRTESVWLRGVHPGTVQAFLELPARGWPTERARTRLEHLAEGGQIALGVRHGLTGEALFALLARQSPRPLASFLPNRSALEGFGLFALEWVPALEGASEWLASDPALQREFGFQSRLEAARLLAGLELHAEGVSLPEASASFARRAGVDPQTARAEALASLRDPLRGIGILGLFELRALLHEQERSLSPARSLAAVISFATAHPELRPGDLGRALRFAFPR